MKTNFKKVCAGMMTVAMIGTMSAGVFAADQPVIPEDSVEAVACTSACVTDENGNVLDENGNIIGNVKDLLDAGNFSGLNVKFEKENGGAQDGTVSYRISSFATAENGDVVSGAVEAETAKSITIDAEGNILDEEGNVIGKVKDGKSL